MCTLRVFVGLVCCAALALVLLLLRRHIVHQQVSGVTLHHTNPYKKDNRTLYMTSAHGGRLGNKMFQYAVLFELTLNSSVWNACINRQRYVKLRPLFEKTLSIPYCTMPLNEPHFITEGSRNANNVLPKLKTLPFFNISLSGYFQSHKYFANSKTELRRDFTLDENVSSYVHSYFRNITPVEWMNTSFVRVGIHVRRGDMASASRIKKYGFVNCTKIYFSRSMQYFEARHPRVQFIVASDNIKWCKDNISGNNILFSNHGYVKDFAILTMSDHVIISVGTFSWWVGWLCTGTTLYNGEAPVAGSITALKEANNSWIPPDDEFNKWVPIK